MLGTLWIFFSDSCIDYFFQHKEDVIYARNIKGWFFILMTGLLLFFLIRKDVGAVQNVNTNLVNGYEQTISGWSHVMDLRHRETKYHSQRVTLMTVALAKLAGITEENKLKCIERGAMLHDIGKIGIPDSILIKPGKLDATEWREMKMHPQIANEILSNIAFLKPSIDIPYYHHEKWDGSGYPQGLQGEEIPLAARLFAVIDVWDALIHSRSYKAAWPEEEVLAYIQEQSGRHFDPNVVNLFLGNYVQLKESSKSNC
jgi:HD-GYP domain-containing protein (c-di-GMP phosphodiesterase class II)